MEQIIKNATVFEGGKLIKKDYTLKTDSAFVGFSADSFSAFNNIHIFPAFCDVHVHFREPGFSYKETIKSGSMSAARGGYTDVCTMPNLYPVPDTPENLNAQTDIIKRDAVINVHPYASITLGEMGRELVNFETLAPDCIAFSDDGRGVQSEAMMRMAMIKAKECGKMIVAHCEDNSLLNKGYIHDGEYAKLHGHRGICSESEWSPIERDLKLAKETGCKYHICHISTAESVELIRRAKAEGVDVTCETAPHYLVLDDLDLEENARFKMNPPIRSMRDKLALIEGIKDGTIDMIATDHAPHSAEEKGRGLEKSLMGVVGLETAFSVMYTYLVKTGVITLERLIELMAVNPRKRFNIEMSGICAFDLSREYTVDPNKFLSMGRATPFEGARLSAECLFTALGDKIVYNI